MTGLDEISVSATSGPEVDGQEHSIPDELRGGLIKAERRIRYHFAVQFAEGRHTLDANCATGSGTLLLARSGAKTVTGVDLDQNVFATSDSLRPENVRFQQGDISALSYPDDSFGLVVSFESIDRCPDPLAALSQLSRVTDHQTGILLVSYANPGVLPREGSEPHGHGLTAEKLLEHLRGQFANVEPLRQHNWVSTAIFDDESFALGDEALPIEARVAKAAGAIPGEELYTLAICSNADLPPVQNGVVITRDIQVKDWLEQIEAANRSVEIADQLVRQADSRADQAVQRQSELKTELVEARATWEASMAALQDQIAWVETHELDLRPHIERHPWIGKLVGLWVFCVHASRRVRRFVDRSN